MAENIKVYGYRWVILIAFSLLAAIIQLQWLTFAPIASAAKEFYGVSALQIDFLSIIYMLVFVVLCIPASYIIDTYGLRLGMGIGAVLTIIASLIKGFYAADYTMVLIAQIGLSIAQPFILNAITKVGVRWFPIAERATIAGIIMLSQYIGIIVVMIATPFMITTGTPGIYNISSMLMIYGIISAMVGVLFLIFLQEKPPTPPCLEGEDVRFEFFKGIRHIFTLRDMWYMLFLFFVGMGMVNAISTCIDQICSLKGLGIEQSGLIGGVMLIGGIFGAIVLPTMSDIMRKRKPFLIVTMIGVLPGLIGMTIFSAFWPVLISAFIFGFFMMAAAPIGIQYAAEISAPAPESTSQGLIMFAGNIAGIIYIVGMNGLGMIPFMGLFIVLAFMNLILTFIIKESKLIQVK
ncbi:MAG: MFS transporter [Candidatus Margulisbacteria bacterium]|nr:MFS transporter [Candidatus Margulisiibacteriota bacterium]